MSIFKLKFKKEKFGKSKSKSREKKDINSTANYSSKYATFDCKNSVCFLIGDTIKIVEDSN